MDVSIICSTWRRTALLERSAQTWLRSIEHSGGQGEILIFNDDPEEEIWNCAVNRRVRVLGNEDKSAHGSHATGYNRLMEIAEGDVWIFTHPEVLFPNNAVKIARTVLQKPGRCLIYKVYLLYGDIMQNLEDLPWREPEKLEKRILSQDPPLHANQTVRDLRQRCASTQTFALTAQDAQKIGPFPEFGSRGPNDPWHQLMRREVGLIDLNIKDGIVYHQSHDYYRRPPNELAISRAIQAVQEWQVGQPYTEYECTNGPDHWGESSSPKEEGKV